MKYSFLDKFVDNIIMFMLVMSGGGMVFIFHRNLAYLLFIAVVMGNFIFFGKRIISNIFYSSFLTFSLISLLLLLNYFLAITVQEEKKYAYYITVVFTSVLVFMHFYNNRNRLVFQYRLYFILKLIVFHALANFLLFFIFKNHLSLVSTFYHDYNTLFNIFYYPIDKDTVNIFGFEFFRNQGLFWEPGVLQVFLNIFFFLEAFVFKKSKSILLVTILVIFTTYSTTGMMIIFVQLIVFLLNEIKINKWTAPFFLILLIPFFLVFSLNLEDKIHGEKESSFQKRLFDLTQPFFMALEHPLSGIGLDLNQFQDLRKGFYFSSSTLNSIQNNLGIDSKVTGTEKGSSNSIMALLACTGFPTTILFMIMFFRQKIIVEKKWLFMIIITLSVMSVPLLLRPFFFIFIVSGFMCTFNRIISHKKLLS